MGTDVLVLFAAAGLFQRSDFETDEFFGFGWLLLDRVFFVVVSGLSRRCFIGCIVSMELWYAFHGLFN